MDYTVVALIIWAILFALISLKNLIAVVKDRHGFESEFLLSFALSLTGIATAVVISLLFWKGVVTAVPLYIWGGMVIVPILSWFFAKEHEVFGPMLFWLHGLTILSGIIMIVVITKTWAVPIVAVVVIFLILVWVSRDAKSY